jgi:hypothetical protein
MFELMMADKKPVVPNCVPIVPPEDVKLPPLKLDENVPDLREKDYYSGSKHKDSYHSHYRDREGDDRESNSLSKWSDDDRESYRERRHSKHGKHRFVCEFNDSYCYCKFFSSLFRHRSHSSRHLESQSSMDSSHNSSKHSDIGYSSTIDPGLVPIDPYFNQQPRHVLSI